MDTSWNNTREALKGFMEILICRKCGKKPLAPVRYSNCGHFVCRSCTDNSNCSKCGNPVQPNEIQHDHIIANLTRHCDAIAEIINEKNLWTENNQSTKSKALPEVPQKITQRRSSYIPKSVLNNINKRNAKGETPLHNACIKGQEEYVKSLLAAGANPNTKDNANWTPLQEAVSLGYYNICAILLEAGASPNTPGFENKTALHEAVIQNRLNMVELLLHYHAKIDVYDQYGKSPIDYCNSTKMKKLLSKGTQLPSAPEETDDLNRTLDQSVSGNNRLVILDSNLSPEKKKLLPILVSKHKIKVVSTFSSSVNIVFVEANEQNTAQLTYDIMLAILHGKWILNSEWISLSLELDNISEMELGIFELSGVPVKDVPQRARKNAEKQNPRLFNRCYFYFALYPKFTYYIGDIALTKESLIRLVTEGEGSVLVREPDPEDIKEMEDLSPFHAAHDSSHPLYKCTHYIIYVPGKDEPRIKYNMPHIKTLPLMWLIECIEKFQLIDPSYLGLV